MLVRKATILPAKRQAVFERLQRLETLQAIAAPYATFEPVDDGGDFTWRVGGVSSYRMKLFGLIPFGTHTIRIERFDVDAVVSREGNARVPVWNHRITMEDLGARTRYANEVEIEAGWKTIFVWLWANAFYAHRQRKWKRLLKEGDGR